MVIALSLVKGWVKCPAAAVCALQEHYRSWCSESHMAFPDSSAVSQSPKLCLQLPHLPGTIYKQVFVHLTPTRCSRIKILTGTLKIQPWAIPADTAWQEGSWAAQDPNLGSCTPSLYSCFGICICQTTAWGEKTDQAQHLECVISQGYHQLLRTFM